MEITDLLWNLFHGSISTNGSVGGDGLGVVVSTLVDWRGVAGAAQRGGKRGESQIGGGEPSGAVGVSDVVKTLTAQRASKGNLDVLDVDNVEDFAWRGLLVLGEDQSLSDVLLGGGWPLRRRRGRLR